MEPPRTIHEVLLKTVKYFISKKSKRSRECANELLTVYIFNSFIRIIFSTIIWEDDKFMRIHITYIFTYCTGIMIAYFYRRREFVFEF